MTVKSTPTPSSSPLLTPAASETEVQVASAGFVGPPDLALWRQRLFQLTDKETVTLLSAQWQHYWPFMRQCLDQKHRVRSTEAKTNNTYPLELPSV